MPAVDLLAVGAGLLEIEPRPSYGPVSMAVPASLAFLQAPLKIIERPRLTRLLDETGARIIMLIAPAGYGKTTLAHQWMATRAHAWHRGTVAAADVAALALGLCEVLQPLVAGAGERMIHRLRATGAPEQDVVPLAELLAEDLADWPENAWLVIDDYQFASESAASERFVDLLIGLSPIQLFLASRVRPSWATARRLLYGEIYELGRSNLAMSQDEASEVLAHLERPEASGIAALADGWPAVIGLASLARRLDLPEDSIPDTLHEYFAEELYRQADPTVRTALCRLSIVPTISAEIAELALGPEAETMLAEGVRIGFLTPQPSGAFELHPLLRAFLSEKLTEERAAVSEELVDRLVRFLIAREAWDDAFTLVERFFSEALFVTLLEIALPSLLTDARTPTLARWLVRAVEDGMDAPIIVLADAEVALRDGNHPRAEALAVEAARRFGREHELSSRAHWIAGMAAHLLDRNIEAFEHHSTAARLAQGSRDYREALNGLLQAAGKLELPSAHEILQSLVEANDGTPESQLRLTVANFTIRSRLDNLIGVVEMQEAARHFLERVHDPLIRTAYRNCYAQALSDRGRYADALKEATKTLDEASDAKLAFVIPYAQLVCAAAHSGLRNFARAIQLLDHLEDYARDVPNEYIRAETATRRCKTMICQGLAARALEECELTTLPAVMGERGEYLAARSLGLVCVGEAEEGLRLMASALEVTRSPHVRATAPWISAIAALRQDLNARGLVCDAFRTMLEIGDIDAFVCVYRAVPEILRILARRSEWRGQLIEILERARDDDLGKRFGLASPRSRRRRMASPLTPREQDVCNLLAQGFSNKEIARALFISESTTKVHVRHILAKLGVRSRAAAAVRASSERLF